MRDPKITSKIMSHVRSSGGKAETLLGKTMWSLGLRYRKQYPIKGKPDYVLVRTKIAIFCDGDFWHGRNFKKLLVKGSLNNNKKYWIQKIPRNMERDKKVNKELQDTGWIVLRFWESDILKDSISCAQKVFETHKKRLSSL